MTDEQELRRWCLDKACAEPTDDWDDTSTCLRKRLASAAAYERYITDGHGDEDLERLVSEAEASWGVARDKARLRCHRQNEDMAAAAGRNAAEVTHASGCSLHNGPAFAPLPCDCGAL